jgi:SHAQKYF class myb-like DNA-binding protein
MVQDPVVGSETENDALLAQLLSAEEETADALYYANGNDWIDAFSWASPEGLEAERSQRKGRHKRNGRRRRFSNIDEYDEDGEDDDDEDWIETVKNRRPRSTAVGRRPTASAPTAGAQPVSSERERGDSRDNSVGRDRNPSEDSPERGRKRPTAWSPEEEQRFLEALELYGRDWRRAAAHVGTRSASNFRSHAQKYFIKLYKEGRPVPPKVAETGAGHTLSGKPLDPNSAAARAYLQGSVYRKELRSRHKSSGAAESQAGSEEPDLSTPKTKHASPEASVAAPTSDIHEDEIFQQMQLDAQLQAEEASAPYDEYAKENAHQDPEYTVRAPSMPGPAAAAEPPEYAKRRPKRSTAGRRSIRSLYNIASADDELRFVSCLSYEPDAQPFRIVVQPRALFMMDLHAHLDLREVIGFLGGRYDTTRKQLEIIDAFACRAAQGRAGHLDVELDPESAVEARNTIEVSGLAVVAWYHSHPTFPPEPSVRDLDNQRNYQKQFESEGAPYPFLAAIISPYDPNLPSVRSAIQWFHVGLSPAEDSFAFRLQWEPGPVPLLAPAVSSPASHATSEKLSDELQKRVQQLLDNRSVKLDTNWSLRNGERGERSTLRRGEKLLRSLRSRVSETDADGLALLEELKPALLAAT